MKIKWLGHASFLITSASGLKILIDPYTTSGNLKYGPIKEAADIVTISHEHGDHNNLGAATGKPELVKGAGTKQVKSITFKGIPTHHDTAKGQQRGANTIFCFTLDGLKLCHLGDLGHELSQEQIKDIGEVDILMIPVGGFFTIDAAAATKVSQSLNPHIILPMHYKTPKCDLPITGVDDFLKGKAGVKRVNASEIEFQAGKMPAAMEFIVLNSAF